MLKNNYLEESVDTLESQKYTVLFYSFPVLNVGWCGETESPFASHLPSVFVTDSSRKPQRGLLACERTLQAALWFKATPSGKRASGVTRPQECREQEKGDTLGINYPHEENANGCCPC